jgi:hypothetical protein
MRRHRKEARPHISTIGGELPRILIQGTQWAARSTHLNTLERGSYEHREARSSDANDHSLSTIPATSPIIDR